jgi:hypothetical protein
MRFQFAGAVLGAVALAAAPAQAHHSFAMFDMTKEVTVSGTVRQFQWTNPHAYIQLIAKDAGGHDVEYSLEMGAPMYLYARGWRPSSIRAGMRITGHAQSLAQRPPGGVVPRRGRAGRQADRHQPMNRRLAFALAAASFIVFAGPAPAQDAAYATSSGRAFAKLPYWPGYWVSEQYNGTTISGTAPPRPAGSPPLQRLNGFDAPWNDEGKARQAEAARTRGGRRADGWGYPMMMDAATPFQVMITPEETLIVNAYGETRHIYTDGRPFPAAEDMWPTVWGTSIGHWEGDTLVIETVQVRCPTPTFTALRRSPRKRTISSASTRTATGW